MKKSKMTYELFEVARLILDKEDRLSIVIRHLEAEQRPDALLAVSVPDGHPFLSEGDAVSHVMSRHLDKFFDVVEVEVEAPKGSFLMVAKCSQTGKLLGAPTHHSYQRNLREHHARHCPNVPFDAFKGRLEMVREQDQIDAWLKSMSTRSEYAPTDRKEGEPERLESLDAARGFLQAFRKDLVVKTHPWVRFAGRLLEELNPGPLRDSVRYALEQQRAFPLDTANGIRGRLRKEGFHLYKKGSKGITYACSVRRRCRDPKSTFSDPMAKLFDSLDRKPAQQAKDLVVKTHPWVRFAGRLLEELNPGPLRDSVRYALEQQRAFPLDTANGIRGRLRKEGFHLYKKGSKGITYACSVRRRCRDPKVAFSDPMAKLFDSLDRKPAQQAKDLVLALAGENAEEAAKTQVLTDLSFLIGEGYIANLPDGRLFAQPILSSQAQAKEEAANDEAAEESK